MKLCPLLAGVLAVLLASAGCGPGSAVPTPAAPTSQPIVATQPTPTTAPAAAAATSRPAGVAAVVNGETIAMDDYEAQATAAIQAFYQQPGNSPEMEGAAAAEQALRAQVLELLIDQRLVEQAAARAGVTVDDAQVTAEVEQARSANPSGFADWLAANGFTEETFRAHTRAGLLADAMRARVTGQVGGKVEQVHLLQIVVPTEAEARDLLAQVKSGAATFEDLAAAQGSDLGFVPRGVLPSALEEVAFGLQPGQAAGPVQSRAGWHIIKLVERDPARDIPPEMLADLQQETYNRWLAQERAQATIERYVP